MPREIDLSDEDLTVGFLRELLADFDDDAPIFVRHEKADAPIYKIVELSAFSAIYFEL